MPPKQAKAKPAESAAEAEALLRLGPAMPWTGEVVPTNSTAGRCYHICTLWDGKLLMFGGWCGQKGHCADVAEYDFATSSWSTLETVGDPHPGTSQAAAADVGGALLFFGGWNGKMRVNALTMFQLDGARWAPFATVGDLPPPTTFHTCTFASKRLYVFGGNTAEGQSSEMRVLDLNTTQWSAAHSSGAPPKRSSHTASLVNLTTLVIFGGRGGPDGTQALNDVAVFDTIDNHWVIGAQVDGVVAGRFGHSAIAVGNKIIFFGGVGEKEALVNDVLVLEVVSQKHLVWSKIAPEGPAPSPRTGHYAVECMTGMYVVGGRTDAVAHTTSEIYLMDLSPIAPQPSAIEDETPPPPQTAETLREVTTPSVM